MRKLLEQRYNPLFAITVAFMLGFFLVNDLDLRYLYVYALLGVLLIVGAVSAGVWRPGMQLQETMAGILHRITPLKACFLALTAVAAVFSLLPNSNWGHLVLSLTISMLMFAAYLLLMEPGEAGIRRAIAAVHGMSLLFSAYVIVVKLWPQLYWTYVYPWLGPYVQEQADRYMPQGYGVLIGGSATYSNYVTAIALLANFGQIFIGGGLKSRRQALFAVLSTVLYLTAFLLMNRRSEVLALGAAGVVLLILCPKVRSGQERLRRLGAVAAILLTGALVLTPLARLGHLDRYLQVVRKLLPEQLLSSDTQDPEDHPGEDAEPDEADRPTQGSGDVTGGRIGLWKQAWSLFREKPLFGIGWEQFMNHNAQGHDVHNTYLQWLCETGVVGFLLLLTPLGLIYGITLRQALRLRKPECMASAAIKRMNVISLGLQTFFLTLNLIDPSFYHLNFFCFFAFTVILEETALRLERPDYARSDVLCLLSTFRKNMKHS